MAEQKIKGFNWLEELELEPEFLREIYTTDFFQRTLAHLFGFYENRWKALRVNADGELIVQTSEKVIEKYDVIEATAGDNESTPYYFNFPEGITATKVVEIHTGLYPILVRFIPTDDTVLEKIYHPASTILVRAIAVKGFTIQNAIAGQNADIRVIGWY